MRQELTSDNLCDIFQIFFRRYDWLRDVADLPYITSVLVSSKNSHKIILCYLSLIVFIQQPNHLKFYYGSILLQCCAPVRMLFASFEMRATE